MHNIFHNVNNYKYISERLHFNIVFSDVITNISVLILILIFVKSFCMIYNLAPFGITCTYRDLADLWNSSLQAYNRCLEFSSHLLLWRFAYTSTEKRNSQLLKTGKYSISRKSRRFLTS